MSSTDWTKPQDVSGALMVFPGSVSHLMPPREECEKALDAMDDGGQKWREFQQLWFFQGLDKTISFQAVDGVDPVKAFRHLHCIQGSFEPKHEHKEAAVAYLSSLWFKDVPA